MLETRVTSTGMGQKHVEHICHAIITTHGVRTAQYITTSQYDAQLITTFLACHSTASAGAHTIQLIEHVDCWHVTNLPEGCK